jgi:hypothetical protein
VSHNQPVFFSPLDVLVAASYFSNMTGLFTCPEHQLPPTPSPVKGMLLGGLGILLALLDPEDETDRLSQNVVKQLPANAI